MHRNVSDIKLRDCIYIHKYWIARDFGCLGADFDGAATGQGAFTAI